MEWRETQCYGFGVGSVRCLCHKFDLQLGQRKSEKSKMIARGGVRKRENHVQQVLAI